VAGRIKLNLGCGDKILPGFVNVDLADNWSGLAPDVVSDVTRELPFADAYADEVHAYHLLEHVHRWEADDVLREWARVLKPGGEIVLEMPCLDSIIRLYAKALIDGKEPHDRLTILGLYGDPDYRDARMSHRWCYSKRELAGMLYGVGLCDVKDSKPLTHQPLRDMRMTARKP
jgi:predicted SAM-dependent methyltransferase